MSKNHSAEFKIKNVLVSAKVGERNELERRNERDLGQLFSAGYKIENSNGEIDFSLTNLEERIVTAADSFLFLPIPPEMDQPKSDETRKFFREMFKAASLFVAAQTKDPLMRINHDPDMPLKPIILVNHKGCWDPLINLINNMHELGTVTQKPETIITSVNNVAEAITHLKQAHEKKTAHVDALVHKPHVDYKKIKEQDPELKRKPEFNVCVFCSASTKNEELLASAKDIGTQIASEGWGVISGLGSSGMMGKVVEGAAEVIKSQGKGWVGGSNLPRIMDIEGLPEYYDKNWVREDIYTRMEVMIKESQAMVVMPGGMGSVQELMAMLLLKHNRKLPGQPYIMRDDKFGNKPIILVNQQIKGRGGHPVKFWEPVVKMAEKFGFQDDIKVVGTVEEAMDYLKNYHLEKAALGAGVA